MLIAEDNEAERFGVSELLSHPDIEIATVDSGRGALDKLRSERFDCMVLDLRLPDLSGFEVLEEMQRDDALADLPVVVFTGRDLSPEEDAKLHTMARSIVVKGAASPERLFDETALFLHQVADDLPDDKKRMLERLHSSDEMLAGRTVLVVDDDTRNIFALSSALERRGMQRADGDDRPRGGLHPRALARGGDRADGHHDARDGRLRDHRADPRQSCAAAAADRGADRQGDEGRPREVPGGRRLRLPRQAGQHRAALLGAAAVAAPLTAASGLRPVAKDMDKVNILLIDDQPAKLLSYEVILAELGENLIKANSPQEALGLLLRTDNVAVVLIDVVMPGIDGFELAAMIREHPRFSELAIIFVSAIQVGETDHLRGYEIGAVDYVSVPVVPKVLRAKVRVFVDLYRKTRQLEALNTELEERVAARTAELEAQTERLRHSEERRSIALSAGDMGSWEVDVASGHIEWDDGPYRIFDVDPATFEPTVERIEAMIHPDDRAKNSLTAILDDGESRFQVEFRIVRPSGEVRWCYGAGIISRDAAGQAGAHERRHRRHHRAQARRGAPGAAGARGRPSRQEHAGRGAVGAAADARADHRGIHHRRRGPRACAGRHAQSPVLDALGGR